MIEILLIIYLLSFMGMLWAVFKHRHEFDTLNDLLSFSLFIVVPMLNTIMLLVLVWEWSKTVELRKAKNDS
jgi:hypothetical protein